MSGTSKWSVYNARMRGFSPAQHILSALCYVTAMMIWIIGNTMVYSGTIPLWFVYLITALVVASGISFQFEGVL